MARYQINTTFDRPDPALVARAANVYACIAGPIAGPRQVVDPAIKPLRRDWRICGPAFTVRTEFTDDGLIVRLATKYVRPGDILIVDNGGRLDCTCFGASMAWGAKEAGCAGVVIDGVALTGELLIDREGLPIYSRGLAARNNTAEKPGWMNVPVVCGGVIVHPGDIVLGDEDGIVILPLDRAAEIVEKAGEGRLKPFPPPSRNVPYHERVKVEEKMRELADIEWK